MKNFLSHITELFDRPLDFFLWDRAYDTYRFEYILHGGKIHSFSSENSERTMSSLGISNTDTIPAVTYNVTFTPMSEYPQIGELVKAQEIVSDSDIGKVFKIGFERREGNAVKSKPRHGGISATPRWQIWSDSESTDDDLSRLSAQESIAVFSTVAAIARSFVSAKNPAGIVFGTKRGANPARARVYDAIAKRNQGRILVLPDAPRDGIENIRLVWLK